MNNNFLENYKLKIKLITTNNSYYINLKDEINKLI